jgi:outer membrane protein OmpA-like peptidoglycan-associated protein
MAMADENTDDLKIDEKAYKDAATKTATEAALATAANFAVARQLDVVSGDNKAKWSTVGSFKDNKLISITVTLDDSKYRAVIDPNVSDPDKQVTIQKSDDQGKWSDVKPEDGGKAKTYKDAVSKDAGKIVTEQSKIPADVKKAQDAVVNTQGFRVNFAFNKADITADEQKLIDGYVGRLATAIKDTGYNAEKNGPIKIPVFGFADTTGKGDAAANQKIAEDRRAAVIAALNAAIEKNPDLKGKVTAVEGPTVTGTYLRAAGVNTQGKGGVSPATHYNPDDASARTAPTGEAPPPVHITHGNDGKVDDKNHAIAEFITKYKDKGTFDLTDSKTGLAADLALLKQYGIDEKNVTKHEDSKPGDAQIKVVPTARAPAASPPSP